MAWLLSDGPHQPGKVPAAGGEEVQLRGERCCLEGRPADTGQEKGGRTARTLTDTAQEAVTLSHCHTVTLSHTHIYNNITRDQEGVKH